MLAAPSLPALIVVAVLLLSGIGKLLDLDAAPSTLRALRITGLPPRAVVAAVATGEIVVAAGLLLGTGLIATVSAAGALALALLFLAVGVRAQARASTDECGCFGRLASTRVGPAMTTRNAAITALAALALIGAGSDPRAPALATRLVLSPGSWTVLVLSAAAIAVVGATLRTPAHGVEIPAGDARDAALITPDGAVVVPRQRALRGRAQLLLFVRRGCGSCENIIDRMTWDGELLESLVDVRLIVAVGDDSALSAAGDGLHADPSGEFARALGIPGDRPAGVLLTTAGNLLLPIAVGGEETASLVDSVLAAAADARGPRTDGAASST
jgi:uncharacterized membrane protein YphA (DoxX/SURF4 family)